MLLSGLMAASVTVQRRTERIWEQVRMAKPTDVFTMNISAR